MRITEDSVLPADDLGHAFDAVGEANWRGLSNARVLLTGGTGFVGKWLMATLLEANRRLALDCDLIVLSRYPAAFRQSYPTLADAARVTLVGGDVRDFAFPSGRFTHVIHAAADVVAQNTPRDTFATCVDGTRRVLEFSAQADVSDLLLVSSGAVYGRQPPHIERLREDHVGAPDPLATSSAYGEGKRVSEWLGAVHAAESGLRVKVARCFAFVGPWLALDKHFAIGNFMRDAMAGNRIVIQGDGTPCRTYLHAADMAAWLWAALLRGQSGTAYNVGGDEIVSISDLAHRVVKALDSSAEILTLKQAQPGTLPERYIPDVARAREMLCMPRPIGLDAAIVRTAHWHRESRLQS